MDDELYRRISQALLDHELRTVEFNKRKEALSEHFAQEYAGYVERTKAHDPEGVGVMYSYDEWLIHQYVMLEFKHCNELEARDGDTD